MSRNVTQAAGITLLPNKPWYQQTLALGTSWTVPAGVSLVTVSACAAGGPSAGGGCATNNTAAGFSVPAASGSLVSGMLLGANLVYQSGNTVIGAFNSPFLAINPDRTSGRLGSLFPGAAYAMSYGCADKTVVNGNVFAIVAGYSSSAGYLYLASSPDAFITTNTTSTGTGSPTAIGDIIVDTTGTNKGVVVAGTAGSYGYAYAWADPTLASITLTATAFTSANGFLANAPSGGRFLNGNYVIFGAAYTTSYPRLCYATTATGAWTGVTLDTVVSTIQDMAYSSTLGLYVAVTSTGAIYTAATINGGWTKQTSGTTNPLNGVLWANGVFIAVGNSGTALVSTNGTLWTAATGLGASAGNTFPRRGICWAPLLGVFVLGDTSGYSYTSPTGAAWTAGGTCGSGVGQILYTPAGAGGKGTLWSLTGATVPYYSTNSGTTWAAFSTLYPSYAGGTGASGPGNRADTIIAKNSIELFRLRGGMGGGASLAGNGGSYRGGEPVGAAIANTPGIGPGGVGGINAATPVPAMGSGGPSAPAPAGSTGGGAPLLYETLMGTPELGVFQPGGSGGWNGASNAPGGGGGGSLFSRGQGGGAGSDASRAPGRGSTGQYDCFSTRTHPGGGGESVFRQAITCTPGDVLECWPGLATVLYNNSGGSYGVFAGDGYAIVEWQM